MNIYAIAAIGQQGQLGLSNRLPWPRLSLDQRWFQSLTTAVFPLHTAYAWIYRQPGENVPTLIASHARNVVIAGRRTATAFPDGLPGRHTLVVSSALEWRESERGFTTLAGALGHAEALYAAPHAFLIGGASIYQEGFAFPALQTLFLTEVEYHGDADVHWPLAHIDLIEGLMVVDGPDSPRWQRLALTPWLTDRGDVPSYRLGIWERI